MYVAFRVEPTEYAREEFRQLYMRVLPSVEFKCMSFRCWVNVR